MPLLLLTLRCLLRLLCHHSASGGHYLDCYTKVVLEYNTHMLYFLVVTSGANRHLAAAFFFNERCLVARFCSCRACTAVDSRASLHTHAFAPTFCASYVMQNDAAACGYVLRWRQTLRAPSLAIGAALPPAHNAAVSFLRALNRCGIPPPVAPLPTAVPPTVSSGMAELPLLTTHSR